MEVHETMVTVEAALSRAERAAKTLARKGNPYPYLTEAMERVVKELDDLRRRLMQGTYWAMEEVAPYDEGVDSPVVAEQSALFDLGPTDQRLL